MTPVIYACKISNFLEKSGLCNSRQMANRLVFAAHINISVCLFSRAHVVFSAAGVFLRSLSIVTHRRRCLMAKQMNRGCANLAHPPPTNPHPSLALRTPGISRRIANTSLTEPTTVLPKCSLEGPGWGVEGRGELEKWGLTAKMSPVALREAPHVRQHRLGALIYSAAIAVDSDVDGNLPSKRRSTANTAKRLTGSKRSPPHFSPSPSFFSACVTTCRAA